MKTSPDPIIADYIAALDKSFSESGQILTRLWRAYGTSRINTLVQAYFDNMRQEKRELEEEIAKTKTFIARCFALRNHPELGGDARAQVSSDVDILRGWKSRLETEFKGIE